MTTNDSSRTARPLGYWLTAVDRLLAAEFAAAFEHEGLTRRDWRLLNVIDGSAPAPRPLREHKLRRLIDRGWIVGGKGHWALTPDGRAAKARLGAVVDRIRARVSDAVPAEDLATTLRSLEQIAVSLGWDEHAPLPQRPGRGRGRGRKHPHGLGHDHFAPRGFGGPHRGPAGFAWKAYERGFDAGFSRGMRAA